MAKPLREQQQQGLQCQLMALRSEDVKFDPRLPPASLTRLMKVTKRLVKRRMKVAKPLMKQQLQELQCQLKTQGSEDVKFDPRPPPFSLTGLMMVDAENGAAAGTAAPAGPRGEDVKFDPRPPPAPPLRPMKGARPQTGQQRQELQRLRKAQGNEDVKFDPRPRQRQQKAQKSEDVKFDPRPLPASLEKLMKMAGPQMDQQQ